MTTLIDNDIILKACCYGLANDLLLPVCESLDLAGVLGTARFVIPHRIKRIGLNGGPQDAILRAASLLGCVSTVEPTEGEQMIAADLELAAQRAGLGLDTGESHLCALALSRGIRRLLTGDKRAIVAIEILLDRDSRLSALCGRIWCLEQLVILALGNDSTGSVRLAICGQPAVDKTLAICSGCRAEATKEVMVECLESYLRDLRGRAARVLSA